MGFDVLQRPLKARRGDPNVVGDFFQYGAVLASTAASTGLQTRGLVSLATTSTGAPVVYTLSPQKLGDWLEIGVAAVASSSDAPLHINMASGVTLDGGTQDMITLSTAGSGVTLRAFSTSHFACVGTRGATFSTST